MRRCPDCGFRANDTTCPLCGVKMKPLPAAEKELQTHAHKQAGESCTLPNSMPVKQISTQKKAKTKNSMPINPKMIQAILVLVIVVLFRACGVI